MDSLFDWFHVIWFRQWRGSALWGWLVAGIFAAIIIGCVISVALGFDPPSRCNANGDCFPEY